MGTSRRTPAPQPAGSIVTTRQTMRTTDGVTPTAVTPTPMATATTPTPTGIPQLSAHWAMLSGNNLTKALKDANIDFVEKVRSANPDAFSRTDIAPLQQVEETSINFGKTTSNLFNALNESGVAPENAQAAIRNIFTNPQSRIGVLGKDSLFNNPAYKNNLANASAGGNETFDENAIKQLAGLYAKTKRSYDAMYNVAPGTRVPKTAPSGVAETIVTEAIKKTPGVRVRVSKKP